jgi:hypothetical protein
MRIKTYMKTGLSGMPTCPAKVRLGQENHTTGCFPNEEKFNTSVDPIARRAFRSDARARCECNKLSQLHRYQVGHWMDSHNPSTVCRRSGKESPNAFRHSG